MKNLLIYALIVFCCAGFLYLAGAFIAWDMHPGKWDGVLRGCLFILLIPFSVAAIKTYEER